MSVRMATPEPLSTRLTASRMLLALLDVVVGADGDGFDLLLRTHHMLKGRAKLGGEPPVGHEYEADHSELPAGALLRRTKGRTFRLIRSPNARAVLAIYALCCAAESRGQRRLEGPFWGEGQLYAGFG